METAAERLDTRDAGPGLRSGPAGTTGGPACRACYWPQTAYGVIVAALPLVDAITTADTDQTLVPDGYEAASATCLPTPCTMFAPPLSIFVPVGPDTVATVVTLPTVAFPA